MRKIGLVLVMFLCLGVGSLCCSDDTWATFYSDSNVSNRSSSNAADAPNDFKSTKGDGGEVIVGEGKKIHLRDNPNMTITFSNNIYGDNENESNQRVEWQITRSVEVDGKKCEGFFCGKVVCDNSVCEDGGKNYDITFYDNFPFSSIGTYSKIEDTYVNGVVCDWITNSKYYSPKDWFIASDEKKACGGKSSSRPYTDNKVYHYVHRDYFQVRFKKPGTYKFCETMFIDGRKTSSACSQIEVVDDGASMCMTEPFFFNSYKENKNKPWNNSVTSLEDAFIKSGVKNNDADFIEWNEEVYAKPGDTTEWFHCYYPDVQKTIDKQVVTKLPELCKSSATWKTVFIEDNLNKSAFTIFENKFKVSNDNMLPSNSGSGSFSVGDSSARSWGVDFYSVQTGKESKAGKELKETMTSGIPRSVWTERKDLGSDCCEYAKDEEGKPTNVCLETDEFSTSDFLGKDKGSAFSNAVVKVPYNYRNTASVSIGQGNVFAGETVVIGEGGARFSINPTYNKTTKGTYATKVKDAKIRLIAYVPKNNNTNSFSSEDGKTGDCGDIGVGFDECSVIAQKTRVFNEDENTNGRTELDFNDKNGYNVFDVDAGRKYCVVAAIYPARSHNEGEEGKSMDTSGNNKWFISAPSCVTVAKRPSLQVWGGSLYTAGNISTSVAKKRVVSGKYSIQDFSGKDGDGAANSTDNTTVFGSWVEQSIIANGTVAGLASGAATGYNNLEHDESIRPLGGDLVREHMSLCEYGIALTIPNSTIDISGGLPGIARCSNNSVGNNTSNKINEPTDKSALIQNFMGESSNYEYLTKYIRLRAFISDYNEKGLVVENSAAVITMGNRHTYVLHAKEEDSTVDFTIDQDIKYENGKYEDLFDIPKLIIYAKNINIECDVKRIDAVLIADIAVNTCSNANEGDVNSPERSNQLKINGAVIADRMITPRTYGAGTGVASVVSAEIVDYDTSLYLWGSQKAAASNSGKLGTAYQTELPPRY